LVNHFSAEKDFLPLSGPCIGTCDSCDSRGLVEKVEVGPFVSRLICAVKACNGRLGVSKVALVAAGGNKVQDYLKKKMSACEECEKKSPEWYRLLLGLLLSDGYIEFKSTTSGTRSYSVPKLTTAGQRLTHPCSMLMSLSKEMCEEKTAKRKVERRSINVEKKDDSPDDGEHEDDDLLQKLKEWRSERAKASGIPAYAVLANKTLEAIATKRPQTIEELMACPGIGPAKCDQYGSQVLSFCQ
jgi:superfamily II DNA helicase RecQ